jgi:3-hydroxybutyryl-CoA dehydrogenase
MNNSELLNQPGATAICIIGAGTMGSGIAQVAAQSGFNTILYDVDINILEKAKLSIQTNLQQLADKQKISSVEKETIFNSIKFSNNIKDCVANIIIEAIIENAEAKTAIFNQLAAINKTDTVFATNTSSLSVTKIQTKIKNPERVIGMHFFNPAQLMKLVEVISAGQTNEQTIKIIFGLAKRLGKTPVLCKDSPGFIVNRIARHYYLEAMKLVENGFATIENVDAVMEASGFKMGPFKLMDLIGIDINLAVSKSIYQSFNQQERFKPSQLQIDKVTNGELGKKTGKGFYNYTL